MKIPKAAKILFVAVAVVALAAITFMNWPGKYPVGTCLKSEKAHHVLKVEGFINWKALYFVRVVKSNYNEGPFRAGNKLPHSKSNLENDADLSVVDCESI